MFFFLCLKDQSILHFFFTLGLGYKTTHHLSLALLLQTILWIGYRGGLYNNETWFHHGNRLTFSSIYRSHLCIFFRNVCFPVYTVSGRNLYISFIPFHRNIVRGHQNSTFIFTWSELWSLILRRLLVSGKCSMLLLQNMRPTLSKSFAVSISITNREK